MGLEWSTSLTTSRHEKQNTAVTGVCTADIFYTKNVVVTAITSVHHRIFFEICTAYECSFHTETWDIAVTVYKPSTGHGRAANAIDAKTYHS